MTARPFERTEIDEADDDLPLRIVHRRDLADLAPDSPTDGGKPKYDCDYNYLDYTFRMDGEDIEARAYLDEDSTIVVNLTDEALHNPENAEMVLYLQRRFDWIFTIAPNGLGRVLSYKHTHAQ